MARTPTTDASGEVVKTRRTRKPSAPKPAYFILQVMDESGEPMRFEKSRVKVVAIERSGEAVLDKIESGDFPNAFYVRGLLPAGRGI